MRKLSGPASRTMADNPGYPAEGKSRGDNITDVRQHVLAKGWQAAFDLIGDAPNLATLNAAASKLGICNQTGLAIQFVPQAQAAGQRHYEEQIYRTGCVPTRLDSLHDFYNACAWLTFPKTKAALNALHVEQPMAKTRSRLSDAATLFDESGAVLIGPNPALASLIIDHHWRDAFVNCRGWWKDHHLIVFGHAVLEKLHAPYPGMIVKAIYQPWPATRHIDESVLCELDRVLATRWLEMEFTKPSDLFPIPVLGIPDADRGNKLPMYYENTNVFRPKTRKT